MIFPDKKSQDTTELLRAVLFSIRSSTPRTKFPLTKAASSDVRTGYIDGKPVRRLVVTMRAPGCSWVGRSGGCTMCGHLAGTTRGDRPSADEFVRQFTDEISRYDLDDISVISIYNSGSVLNPAELDSDALERIMQRIKAQPSIRKVVLESRAEYVDRSMIETLTGILGDERRLSIAIGLETADNEKRRLCINKGCTRENLETAIDTIRDIAGIQLYVLLGLPFLTEREIVDDTEATLRCAAEMGADEIHIEPATVQRHTLVELLYREGLYRLPSLYSLYEVLRRVVPDIRPYVSPFMHMPLPDLIPHGCSLCTEDLIDGLLERYNIERTPESLSYVDCPCMDTWRERLDETDSRPLEIRISETLSRIARCDVV